MSPAQIVAIVVLALPALAFVLWPVFRSGGAAAGSPAIPDDRQTELAEEKRAIYRALRELEFDHQSGHLSEDDYAALRDRYEARAAQLLKEQDRLEAARPRMEQRRVVPVAPTDTQGRAPGLSPADTHGRAPGLSPARPGGQPRAWTRNPVTLAVGAVVLMLFGLTLGLGVARYTAPDQTMIPPGSRLPVPIDMPGMEGSRAGGREPGGPPLGGASTPIAPEMLRGMLEAARQSLFAGQYREAIAAYQAVLKRDPKNVDALTHLGLVVAIGGHSDTALESFGKALELDPNYAPAYLYRGQVLYEAKQDYRGAIQSWEKFLALTPPGEDHTRVSRLVQEAKARLAGRSK